MRMKRLVVPIVLLVAVLVVFVGFRQDATIGAGVEVPSESPSRMTVVIERPSGTASRMRGGNVGERRKSGALPALEKEGRMIRPGTEFWKRVADHPGVALAGIPERIANLFEVVDGREVVDGPAFVTESRGSKILLGGEESAGELSLSTSSFRIGGSSISLDRNNRFQTIGNTAQASLNEALAIDEHVEVLDQGIEWTWILNRPVSGDVSVGLLLEGAGEAISSGDGEWLVGNDSNGSWIHIGRSVLVDALGRTLDLATDYTPGLATVHVPAAALSNVVFPVAIDPIINPGVDIEMTKRATPNRIPSIASNGDNYLVVWEDHRNNALSKVDVYATRVSKDGAILDADGIAVSRSANDQTDPVVASDGDGYLVIWSDARKGTASRSIYGTLVSADGEVADSQGVLIGRGSASEEKPALAFNGERYLAVWQAVGGSKASVRARRVSTDLEHLDESPLQVAASADKNGSPAVASDGIDFLVVWSADSTGSLDVFGRRIAGTDGMFFEEEPFVVTNADRDQTLPAVASNGDGYLVVWQDFRIGLDVFGARVDGDSGQVLDPAGIAINTAGGSQFNAGVASDGEGYVVTWQDTRRGQSDVFLTQVSGDGSVEDLEGTRVNRTANVAVGPAIASTGESFLIVYQKVSSNSEVSILGQRFSKYEPTEIRFTVESASWLEGSDPVVLDALAEFEAPGMSLISGGMLEVTIADASEGDILELVAASESVTVESGSVVIDGREVALISGVAPTSMIKVSFGENARASDVESVLRGLRFTNDAETPQSGERAVEVKFTDGSGVASPAAKMFVNVTDAGAIPVITKQPMGGSIAEGGEFTLSVEAEWNGAEELTYQWQFEGEDLPGAVLPTILLTNLKLEEAGAYRVVVKSPAASTVSEAAVLEVYEVVSFVERNLPSGYGPGMLLSISLEVMPPVGTEVYAVEDSPPAGWLVEDAGEGAYDSGSGKIKFGPWFGDAEATFTYTVRVPQDAAGDVVFNGVGSADGQRSPVGGDETIGAGVAHPADRSPENGILNIEEVSAYSLAWRKGQAWPVEPSEIPIEFVTSAGSIWKEGELYAFDYSITSAPQWWVSMEDDGVAAADVSEPTTEVTVEPVDDDENAQEVVINVAPIAGTKAWAVEELIAEGWEASGIIGGGVLDPLNGKLKWGPFFDSKARTIGYTLTRAAGSESELYFSGVVSVDGTVTDLRSAPAMGEPAFVTASSRLTSGVFELLFTGETGRSYRIEASSDLASWLEVETIVSGGEETIFVDPVFAQHDLRFYRVIPVF